MITGKPLGVPVPVHVRRRLEVTLRVDGVRTVESAPVAEVPLTGPCPSDHPSPPVTLDIRRLGGFRHATEGSLPSCDTRVEYYDGYVWNQRLTRIHISYFGSFTNFWDLLLWSETPSHV